MDRIVIFKETRERFVDYMIVNDPPYHLSLDLVKELNKTSSLFDLDRGDHIAVWHMMLDEFCPIELWSREYLDLPKRIDELDSNRDYIYGWGHNTDPEHRGTYIYRISNEAIAVMLRLAAP